MSYIAGKYFLILDKYQLDALTHMHTHIRVCVRVCIPLLFINESKCAQSQRM